MTNAPNILRSLITFAICVPLAIGVGYMLTNPMNYSSLGFFAVLALLIASPLLLRWHYPLLVISLQMSCTLFFLMGSPPLWLAMVGLSLGISVLERALDNQKQFIRVPQITLPLIAMIAVVLITAKATGGIGMHAFGSEVYGGRKYVYLLGSILLYFALSARRIPPEQAKFYMTLYFLSGILSIIGDLFPLAPSWAHFVFWIFPPGMVGVDVYRLGETRLGGFSTAGDALCLLFMVRYGIRGIFLSGKPWRAAGFMLGFSMIFLGGYRAALITVGLVFIVQFFLEGLHRLKFFLPAFALLATVVITLLVPFASKLPFTAQRTLAFLPLDLDPQAKQTAQATMDWRLQMWTALLPQVPKHLLLGKGFAISPEDYNEMMGLDATFARAAVFDPSQNPLALSYDYHNGPLSVLIPFGIWGAIAFLWFSLAGFRVLYSNFRHGDPELRIINLFLFAEFVVTFGLFFIGGAINTDMMKLASFLGLSVAINGGVSRPVPQPVPARETFVRPRGVLPRSPPRPAFPR